VATTEWEGKSKDPDSSWRYGKGCYPSVILEVAYSLTTKNLAKFAKEYIMDTAAEIRTVIRVDIDYRTKVNSARISVWRPVFDRGHKLVNVRCETMVSGS
jgi:hypothetical protein